MSASNTDVSVVKDARNQSYWFHILAQSNAAARNLHAVKLVTKAWQQGDRVCIVCDSEEHADELDNLLWNTSPEAFIPHSVVSEANAPCVEPVGVLLYSPAPTDWDTVIMLSATLPAEAGQFKRLALIAHNETSMLDQARSHFKQLRALGIEPKVHDQRKNL
ncbi:DNA polymerase III subunit chi [Marinobacter sp.]|uniref:DNA polymerase III subunit chi n=1 Tax=Marinobacter sp. TaxID=50741 RepID=UPI0034A08A3D